jgi:hypothetical protein
MKMVRDDMVVGCHYCGWKGDFQEVLAHIEAAHRNVPERKEARREVHSSCYAVEAGVE